MTSSFSTWPLRTTLRDVAVVAAGWRRSCGANAFDDDAYNNPTIEVAHRVRTDRRLPSLRRPVLAYLAIISLMTVFAWATADPWIVVGATLFVVSDTVLGWRQFIRERAWMPVTVMVTYHGAIACLALSLR